MVVAAIKHIEAHLKQPLNVKDVCSLSPLSPWQFQRVFRALVGDSIGDYIRRRRLSVAAQQLRESTADTRVLDVALDFQFNSHEAFTRAMKTNFGFTPTEVRGVSLNRFIYAMPKLDQGKLSLINAGIRKEPELKTFGAKLFVGLPRIINSPLGIEAESNGIVSGHWQKFDERRSEIADRVRGLSYGFAFGEHADLADESLTYLAAVEVPHLQKVPAGMQVLEVPKVQYAVFEVEGCLDCCNVTTDFIYGIWFPQSKFVRGHGADFELFDHRIYRRGSPTSISFYFVPIKPV
jgi:AraC family transcriptional regulator